MPSMKKVTFEDYLSDIISGETWLMTFNMFIVTFKFELNVNLQQTVWKIIEIDKFEIEKSNGICIQQNIEASTLCRAG